MVPTMVAELHEATLLSFHDVGVVMRVSIGHSTTQMAKGFISTYSKHCVTQVDGVDY